LPKHVAIAPCRLAADPLAPLLDEAPLLLRMSGAGVQDALQARIDGRSYARATRLVPEDPVEFRVLQEEGQFNLLIDQAREDHADLLLTSELRYQPVVTSDWNGLLAPNLALFLIGGPFCWLLEDTTYSVDVTMTAKLYDLRRVPVNQRATRPWEAAQVTASFETTDLGFLDRAEWYHYLLSLLWPPSFMALETEAARRGLADEIAEEIADQVAMKLRE
jgi:hypothetical protein